MLAVTDHLANVAAINQANHFDADQVTFLGMSRGSRRVTVYPHDGR